MSDLSLRFTSAFDAALARSEEELLRLRALARENQILLDTVLVGIVFVRERSVLRCNPRFEELFGYSPHELDGRSTRVLYQDDDAFAIGGVPSTALAQGKTHQREQVLVRKDGSTFWCRIYGRAIDPAHAHAGSVWLFEDVSERKADEQALQQMLMEQEAILDSAWVGIAFVRNRVIERCNSRFADLFGHATAQVLNQTTRMLYPSDEAFLHGAQPYTLLEQGQSHSTEQQMVRRDGSLFWCRITGRSVDHAHPEQESVWLFEDVTAQHEAREDLEARVQQRTAELAEANRRLMQEIAEREQAESRVRHLANHDELTGMPNRRLLFDHLRMALALARRASELVAVIFLDIDRFKTINDSLGHSVGDELLRSVAQRLAGVVREGDTVARLGGDEFVLVLPQLNTANDVVTVAEKVVETLAQTFHLEGYELRVTASLGIALFPGDGDSPETLLRNADSAMYHAKEAGRDNYQFFASQMNVSAAMRLELENDLHRALQRDEFFLEYQPRIDVQYGHMKGVEALVRWQHPRLGMLYPSRFIPVAEETGLITRLGEWVMRRACSQILQWRHEGCEPFPVAINLSPRQFRQHDFAGRLSAILDDTGVAPSLIELEITESTLMQHTEQTTAILTRLHAMGLSLAIDDFGIGYSNLSYLKRLPVAQMKIDQSFVRDLAIDPTNAAIVSTVATLANKLGLSVVAEGVETLEQLDLVRRCGCGQAQGFLFSRSVPADQVPPMLMRDWLAAFDAVPL